MTVFGKYSSYYNLLYQDKNYAGEAEYIHKVIKQYSPDATSILDLGCGTGRHDFLFIEKGYDVTGIDQSEEMLSVASSTISASSSALTLLHGDIRNIQINKKFDVVISLFHTMSYQSSNEDLTAVFETAKNHLKKGGVFIFDCWYGPTVLTDRPVVRIKRMADNEISILRIADPVMVPNENIVEVNYDIFIRDKISGLVEEVRETHRMRYLFEPEIRHYFASSNMDMLFSHEWLTGNKPGFDTWGVCFGGRYSNQGLSKSC